VDWMRENWEETETEELIKQKKQIEEQLKQLEDDKKAIESRLDNQDSLKKDEKDAIEYNINRDRHSEKEIYTRVPRYYQTDIVTDAYKKAIIDILDVYGSDFYKEKMNGETIITDYDEEAEGYEEKYKRVTEEEKITEPIDEVLEEFFDFYEEYKEEIIKENI
jgi:hypothetical protein